MPTFAGTGLYGVLEVIYLIKVPKQGQMLALRGRGDVCQFLQVNLRAHANSEGHDFCVVEPLGGGQCFLWVVRAAVCENDGYPRDTCRPGDSNWVYYLLFCIWQHFHLNIFRML